MARPMTFVLGVNAVASSSKLQTSRVVITARRGLSSTARRRDAQKDVNTAAGLSDAHKRAYARLRPVIDDFEAPIDLAIAYGSGVIAQANAKAGPPPLTDFIIATPSARAFHAANLRQHPSHYPLYARLLGASAVGWMTEKFGAGMWYVTMVKSGDMEIKYGVISTPTLARDLETWDTLYVSGRLHKPVLLLECVPRLKTALSHNTHAALSLALLQLPEQFTEMQLWEQIAGISYSGDPRMSVPGAENPEKVRNIVRGPGVLQGFRGMYSTHIGSVGLRWVGEDMKQPGEAWVGEGEAVMGQPEGVDYQGGLLSSLPLTLRRNLAARFRPTLAGALVDREIAAERREVKERRAALEEGESRALYDDAEFWKGVAQQPEFRDVLNNEVRHIIKRPALTQSIKGLVTAGLVKSVYYSAAKFRKWLAGRKK